MNWGYLLNRSQQEILERVGHMDQLAGIKMIEAGDGPARGSRMLQVWTGAGLSFQVAADRALDISACQYKGISLAWNSSIGDVHPHTTYARSLVPSEPLEPAFLHSPVPEEETPSAPVNPFGPVDENAAKWVDCPRCGVTQHHSVEICVSCGADVSAHGRMASAVPSAAASPPPVPAPVAQSPLLAQQTPATAVPRAPAGGPRLRCRTCGSHDIELQHGG